ncbi:hypothetical protein [Acinetobacter silvestris]|uniref:Uncharacterized protein n=1 Tax=Acinetobacter silvestris TaxID=1977882 RepID=A0A1Y3CFM5_9GAMM|nr:hypothetical protein [Acinetobacter silvestris]OTG65911.1 hypothetical protein B9T28_06845 [Acinetobacter silvestris]
MKYLLLVLSLGLSSSVFSKSSEDIFLDMAVADNVGAIYVFDEGDDPNKQLGRPNQYTSKISWADKRIDPHDFSDKNEDEINDLDPTEYKGGTIEGFRNIADLNRRYNYIKNITLNVPMLNQYMYKKGLFIMRLDKNFTPSQAKEYEREFNKTVK